MATPQLFYQILVKKEKDSLILFFLPFWANNNYFPSSQFIFIGIWPKHYQPSIQRGIVFNDTQPGSVPIIFRAVLKRKKKYSNCILTTSAGSKAYFVWEQTGQLTRGLKPKLPLIEEAKYKCIMDSDDIYFFNLESSTRGFWAAQLILSYVTPLT